MIMRRCFVSTAIFIVLTLLGEFDGSAAERWSRQVTNSEWIPLANPRAAQLSQSNAGNNLLSAGSTHLSNPIQSLALPPALQQQYQEQLIQLQKTQESIQKLLLLQQQLRAQQQLLQSQTFLPDAKDEKQAPPSSLGNLQTAPESVSPEVLVPPHPSSEAVLPVYPAQSFLPRKPGQVHQNLNDNQELSNLPAQEQIILQHNDGTQEELHTYVTKQGSQRPDGKRLKERPSSELSQSPLIESDEEEEVQLVYVPAETLAQTGQLKRGRGRKQYPVRQHYHQRENQRNVEQTSLSPNQEIYARQVLQQIQKEQEEKAQFLKEERVKEFTRLNEEQKALERKMRLQQEALQREQELLQQKEAEKKRKELEKLEEIARQRELERIREAREKQRQEELERRRLAELRAKEEKRREEEIREREEREKLEQQKVLEGTGFQQNPQALFREQVHRQHLTDNRLKKIRGRQRQRVNQYQEQSNYREVTTTPSPNQPPLSVYMGNPSSRLDSVKVTDVLKILKDAKTIAVLDNVGPGAPQVFVGPSNLDPPFSYAKFDLPYLSSIDHNRVERKVDKLPFFVAPLSFDPPPGYAKIPFPAPHIGSVVVNTLSETSPEPNAQVDEQNSSPTSLIEPSAYNNADQSESIVNPSTTASYESSTAQNFSPESSNAKYESPSGSRFRFRQYYDNKPTSVVSTSYYDEQSITKTKPKQSYYEQESKSITQAPKFDTTDSYRQEISYSNTPNFQDETISPHDPSTKKQDLTTHQLALLNQELAQQIETQKYNAAEQYRSQANNLGESYDTNDVRVPVGPTQYNLPAELPPISPHLPGLVNSLLDKQEENLSVTSTPSPTTTTSSTTTTARVSSTTYRPRGRGRIVPTRSKTTQTPSNKTDRTRRPSYNRSKSRFSTTTEEYRETSYEPTKGKTLETTQKYNAIEHRRPTSRPQKYRNRDKANSQLIQTHQTLNYENYPTQSDSQNNASPDAYSPTDESVSNHQQKKTSLSGVNDYTHESYPSTTPTQTENYQPLREVQHGAPLMSEDYSKSQNYPQNHPQDARYHQDATYDQNNAFEQPKLEQAPVNGFNYQVANENSPDQTNIPQRHKEYSRYQENANYNLAITENPRVRPGEEHRYSPIYEVNVAQTQPDYNIGGQNSFRNIDDAKLEDGAIETDPNASPIFVPLQQSKQEDYELQTPSTEASIIEITTTSTTTPAPVIIRQRVRGRLSGRTHQDSTIQTRPRGSQDEYVRFSVVNHDSRSSSHRNRDGSRTKTRTRPQNHGSQVQTDNNEYIKIHAGQQQKLIATTTPSTTTTTTTTTTTARPEEEDIDYGFIRPPSFRPVQPVHPVDTRFQAPVTYRPALSEIQHIISNDEAAVESSPTHIVKNRPKYNQISTRHPTTKIFTTTTETVPVATVLPDNTVYTVRPKTKPDELKQTRIRGRIRRPGKKRTMTSTESGLEANNELPLDENYPRITSQQLPVTRQQPLYDDNFDMSQFVQNQNRQTQFYEENSENYPPQEFILNFGNLPEQMSQREEYDQTQLASIPSSKYSHSDRVNGQSSGDIYGSESQWSTKLSKTSFQPSFTSNRMTDESKKERGRIRDNQENRNAPEIITAGPEVSSGVTVVVSSDYQKPSNEAGGTDAMMDDALFGMKTNVEDHIEKLNATTAVTTLVLQDQTQSDKEMSFETRGWMRDKEDNSKEQAGDDIKKKITDPLIGRKTRRRRVRVRVRPVNNDDFVTAESQHFNSAVNNLIQDQYKYNPIHESKFTTVQPITVIATTTNATETTQKSLLQDFLEEMLKNDELSEVPTRITSITSTTEIPDWAILTPTTTTIPYVASDDGEVTTLKENYTQTNSAIITSNIEEEHVTMTNKSLTEWKNDTKETTSFEQTVHLSQEESEMQKEAESKYWDKDFQEDKSEQNNLENVEIFSEKYNLASNYPDKSETSKEVEDTIAELINFSTAKKDIQKLSAINKGKEHIMTLKKHEENIEENDAYPKNHRIKWTEVRYPSLDKSQSTLKLQFTTPIPGVVTRNEGNSSVKTLSDYVKAIFDSMKSAENQEEVEEIAKVVETKNETPNKGDQIISTTDSSRDIFTHVNIAENTTNFEEAQSITETTTKGNTTIFETTTSIPDTGVSSEETIITEPSTTTSTTKPMTSMEATDTVIRANSTQTMLGKVLRTSTTTKVSHMTEICYRGRCVMTKPKMDDVMER